MTHSVKEITFPLNSSEYVIYQSQMQCPDNYFLELFWEQKLYKGYICRGRKKEKNLSNTGGWTNLEPTKTDLFYTQNSN